MISVVVGRLENNKVVNVSEGTTVDNALAQAGFVKAENESIQTRDGDVCQGHEFVEAQQWYMLVQKVKSGN